MTDVWRARLILLGILLLAAGLRVYNLNAKSFWFDEFASAELPMGRGYAHYELPDDVVIAQPMNFFDFHTARPIREVWYGEKAGHLPPLYVLLMRLWGEVFGLGPISLRSFSVIASVAAIAALYFAVKELSGTTAALWAAALMALAGPQIQYGQEARNYGLLMLEALVAAAALLRIERRGPSIWRCIALTLAGLAMTLTHYFALGTIVALALHAAIRLRGRSLKVTFACFAAAALLWGILGAPLALRHRHNLDDPRSTNFVHDNSPGHLARTAYRTALLPVRFITEPMSKVTAPAAVGGLAFILAIVLAWRRRDLLLWALWLWLTILPIVLLDLARKTQHLEYVRYTLLASPALYALIAAALSDRPSRIKHLIPALIALACVLALPAAYQTWWKADWRSMARQLDDAANPDDTIVFYRGSHYPAYPNAAYLHTSYYRRESFGPIVMMTKPPDTALLKRLRQSPGLLMITLGGDNFGDALPGATFTRVGYEPGAGLILRVKWNDDSNSATQRSSLLSN